MFAQWTTGYLSIFEEIPSKHKNDLKSPRFHSPVVCAGQIRECTVYKYFYSTIFHAFRARHGQIIVIFFLSSELGEFCFLQCKYNICDFFVTLIQNTDINNFPFNFPIIFTCIIHFQCIICKYLRYIFISIFIYFFWTNLFFDNI